MTLKLAFATCVQLGLSCIEEIYQIGGHLDLLITLHDEKARAKSGRIYLDDFAQEHNIDVLKINNINDEEVIEALHKYDIDWLFIIGWSQIAKKDLLQKPHKGCIGMHPTLLPIGRGRASIPWAILKGLDKTGVTMFKLDEGVDTGDILGQVEVPITENETATQLYEKIDHAHIELIRKYYDDIVSDKLDARKQDDTLATYWEGRKPEDGEIKTTMAYEEADRLIRAVNKPYPGAFYKLNDKKIIVWKAEVADKKENEYCFKISDGFINPIIFDIEEIN